MQWQDLSSDDILDHLTEGLPEDLEYGINFLTPRHLPTVEFNLYAYKGDQYVLDAFHEWNFERRRTVPTSEGMTSRSALTGMKGAGLMIVANGARLLQQLDFNMIHIVANRVGAHLWALAGGEMIWDGAYAQANYNFKETALARLRTARDAVPHDQYERAKKILETMGPGSPDRLSELAHMNDVLWETDAVRQNWFYQKLTQDSARDITLGLFLMLETPWEGRFDLRNEAQMNRLQTLAAQKFRIPVSGGPA